jgi:hypothetical protein
MTKKGPFWLRMLIIMVLSLFAWAIMILFAALIWSVGKFLLLDWLRRPIPR